MSHDVRSNRGHAARPALAPILTLALLLAAVPAALAADTFIESDDYKEGDEIVGVFLTDGDYRVMVEDLERRGQDFDWGWVLTAGGSRDKAPKKKVRDLGFAASDYATIRIPAVRNFAGIVRDEELAEIRDAFVLAAQQLGWEVVGTEGAADLELAVGIVDVNREGGGFGIFKIDPFIEMEIRLRDVGHDRDLMLLRHQKHAGDAEGSALQTANMLVQFLR
ncbi:MAG TPA: hypothetical protein VLF66_03485 [Thermoanaerobaculia bacterium]|nr:hypothetical protein [Thermoanaerobaculia bacterium]